MRLKQIERWKENECERYKSRDWRDEREMERAIL